MKKEGSTYKCENCKEEWGFFPKDFKYNKKYYPTRCVLCSMPLSQMIRENYWMGGIGEVIYWIYKRYWRLIWGLILGTILGVYLWV